MAQVDLPFSAIPSCEVAACPEEASFLALVGAFREAKACQVGSSFQGDEEILKEASFPGEEEAFRLPLAVASFEIVS